MLTFTLAISCLTTSNLPWFMDLTFQVPMPYCSLQHRSVVSKSLRPHGLQHVRLPCSLPSPGTCSNSCPLNQWCDPNSMKQMPIDLKSDCPGSNSRSTNSLIYLLGQITKTLWASGVPSIKLELVLTPLCLLSLSSRENREPQNPFLSLPSTLTALLQIFALSINLVWGEGREGLRNPESDSNATRQQAF